MIFFFLVFLQLSNMGVFVGQVPTTFYFTSYIQYDGTKTRLAKDDLTV